MVLTCADSLQSLEVDGPGSRGTLWSVDWSPDGRFFAVGGPWLGVFDARTRERLHFPRLGLSKSVQKVRWHPRRNVLAVSAAAEDVTAIYDLTDDHKISLPTAEGTRGIAWSSTGTRLATAGSDGSLQIWSEDGTLQHTTRLKDAKSLTGVAWHPQDDTIVTIGELITFYDARGNVIEQIRHRPDEGMQLLLCVEWHPSGDFLVVGDYGNTDTGVLPILQFWSADRKLLKTIRMESRAELRNVSWNPDGSRLASASDALRIWSKDGQLKHEGKSPDLLWGVRWNREGDQLLTSSIEGRVTLWTAEAEVSKRLVEVAPP